MNAIQNPIPLRDTSNDLHYDHEPEHHGVGEQGYKDRNKPPVLSDGQPLPQPQPRPQLPERRSSKASNRRAPPRRVDHTYQDYSTFPLSEIAPRKKAAKNFPSKLHQILSYPDYSHIISWMPHGRAWKIHNKDLLMREIVPKYFVQSKYESFSRQLNGWGFKRLHQSGNDFNAYYHECFLRDRPHLTVLMKRVPRNLGKLIPHVEGEPNFYEIAKQFALPALVVPHNHDHYPPTGYHSPVQYSSYPSSYPPPLPYYTGYQGDPTAVAAYTAHASFPPYSYYSPQSQSQYTKLQLSPEHYPQYPYPPGPPPPFVSPTQYGNPPPNNDVGPGESDGFPLPPVPQDFRQGVVREEIVPAHSFASLPQLNADVEEYPKSLSIARNQTEPSSSPL